MHSRVWLFVTPGTVYSSPGSSVHGISQAILEWVTISSSRGFPDPGIEPVSPALAGGFFTAELPGNLIHTHTHTHTHTRKLKEKYVYSFTYEWNTSSCWAQHTFPTLEFDTDTLMPCFRLIFELYVLLTQQLPKTQLWKCTTSSQEGQCKLMSRLWSPWRRQPLQCLINVQCCCVSPDFLGYSPSH